MSAEILDKGRRKFMGASLAAVSGAAVVNSGLLASAKASAQTKGAGPGKEPMVIGYSNKKGIQIERVTYRPGIWRPKTAANSFNQPESTATKPNRSFVLNIPSVGVRNQPPVPNPR